MSEESLDFAPHRRVDDRNRELVDRLQRLEQQQDQTRTGVTALESTIKIVQIQQEHMSKIDDLRLKMIEDTGKQHAQKLDEIKTMIVEMGSDAEKTPAGREVLGKIGLVTGQLGEHESALTAVLQWKQEQIARNSKQEGAISTLQWIGFPVAGTALLLSVLRLLGWIK